MMLRQVLPALALATVAATTATAQTGSTTSTKPFSVGVHTGPAIPVGDFSRGAKMGFLFGAHGEYAPSSLPVAFRVDADYTKHDYKNFNGNLRLLAFTGNMIYNLPIESAIRPYVIGGLGLYNGKPTGGSGETKFGFTGGAGVTLPLSGFSTFVEVRYHQIQTDPTSLKGIPITVGISF